MGNFIFFILLSFDRTLEKKGFSNQQTSLLMNLPFDNIEEARECINPLETAKKIENFDETLEEVLKFLKDRSIRK